METRAECRDRRSVDIRLKFCPEHRPAARYTQFIRQIGRYKTISKKEKNENEKKSKIEEKEKSQMNERQ